jgi:hypothetical protein
MMERKKNVAEWAAHRPRLIGGKMRDGRKLYRVTHTLFRDFKPAERTTIEFYATKPGPALASIFHSGKSPAEFHYKWYDAGLDRWTQHMEG